MYDVYRKSEGETENIFIPKKKEEQRHLTRLARLPSSKFPLIDWSIKIISFIPTPIIHLPQLEENVS